MPGVLGGIISIFAAGIAKYSDYGNRYEIFSFFFIE
jgi:hypothetical protein